MAQFERLKEETLGNARSRHVVAFVNFEVAARYQ